LASFYSIRIRNFFLLYIYLLRTWNLTILTILFFITSNSFHIFSELDFETAHIAPSCVCIHFMIYSFLGFLIVLLALMLGPVVLLPRSVRPLFRVCFDLLQDSVIDLDILGLQYSSWKGSIQSSIVISLSEVEVMFTNDSAQGLEWSSALSASSSSS
jgi:hypothetical protein